MPLPGRGAARLSTLAPEDRGDDSWIAQRMVLDAGAQAARLTRLASVQAAAVCEAAEREAEVVWQQASAQAAAVREAAEREAERLRATVIKLSAGPAAQPEAEPVIGRPAEPVIGRAAGPASGRAAEPGTRLVRRPQGPPRQLVAIRVAAAATAALFLVATAAGTTEVALHGFAFFVFRSVGTGETGSGGLQEDQGPGQPDAAKPTPSQVKAHQVTADSARRGRCGQRPARERGTKGSHGGVEHCR
jgi:hypothetical protein